MASTSAALWVKATKNDLLDAFQNYVPVKKGYGLWDFAATKKKKDLAKDTFVWHHLRTTQGPTTPPAVKAQQKVAKTVNSLIHPHMLQSMSMDQTTHMIESMLRGQLNRLASDQLASMASQIAAQLMSPKGKAMAAAAQNTYYQSGVGGFGALAMTSTLSAGTTTGNLLLNTHVGTSASNPIWSTGTTNVGTVGQAVYLDSSIKRAVLEEAWYAGEIVHPLDLHVDCKIKDGSELKITMPDGAVVHVNKDGSYHVDDKDAKVTYRASKIRDFNTYINASDKIEGFIKFCGEQGVRRDEFMKLPIELFIMWLVIEAAKADKADMPAVPLLPAIAKVTQPRCGCGRFIPRAKVRAGLLFCRTTCFDRAQTRYALGRAA